MTLFSGMNHPDTVCVYHETLSSEKIKVRQRVLLLSDLHGSDPTVVLSEVRRLQPDLVFCVGDLFEPYSTRDPKKNRGKNKRAIRLLRECSAVCPTFVTLGNHDLGGVHSSLHVLKKIRLAAGRPFCNEARLLAEIERTGAVLLDNDCVTVNGLRLAGISSAQTVPDGIPAAPWQLLTDSENFTVVLCHHPEYYKNLHTLRFDLMLSGHAHGGQWRFGRQGVYAPGQGLFPKYTHGFYENDRLLCSAGLKTNGLIPRFGNPAEMWVIDLQTKEV